MMNLNENKLLLNGSSFRCSCCPYGYHIDVDFVHYCEALLAAFYGSGPRTKFSPNPRGIRKVDVSPPGMGIDEAFQIFCNRLRKQESRRRSETYPKSFTAGPFSSNFLDPPHADNSLNDAVAKFEEVLKEQERNSSSLLKYEFNGFNNSLNGDGENSRRASSGDGMELMDSPPASPSPSNGSSRNSTINKATLAQIREQMAASLVRMKGLEEQVKSIPNLKKKLADVNEEKKVLEEKMSSSQSLPIPQQRRRALDFEDAITQTFFHDLHLASQLSGKKIVEMIESSTNTELRPRSKSREYLGIPPPPPKITKRIMMRSVGISASLAPSLPKKATVSESNIKNLLNRPILVDQSLQTDRIERMDSMIQVFPRRVTVSTSTNIRTRDVGSIMKPEITANKINRGSQTESEVELRKFSRGVQVTKRCSYCELKQTETIGVGEGSIRIKNIGIMTESGLSSLNSSLQSIKLCDKCNESITKSAKDALKPNNLNKSPTVGISKIPRLNFNGRSSKNEIVQTKSEPVDYQIKTNSRESDIIIEGDDDEFLVIRNPNGPIGGKARSSFPNMMAAHQHVGGLRLLDEICKISESESEENEDDVSDSSDEGTYDLEKERYLQRKIKVEPSKEMKAALKVLHDSLIHPEMGNKSATAKSLQIVEKEWFRVSAQKESGASTVDDYLDCFESFSKHLLNHVVNFSDSNGNTAMHYAISHSNFDIVSILLDSKVCDVNKQNKAGYTSIMLVSLAKIASDVQKEVIRRLFAIGDVNIRAKQNGQTALMLASSHGQFITCKLLIEAGAALNVQDNDGSTAIMCASEHGHKEVVRLLLSHTDCDPNITDNDGSTALSIAMEAGHKDIGLMLYASTNMLSRGSSPYASLRRSQSKAIASTLRRTGSFTGPQTEVRPNKMSTSSPSRSRKSSISSTRTLPSPSPRNRQK